VELVVFVRSAVVNVLVLLALRAAPVYLPVVEPP